MPSTSSMKRRVASWSFTANAWWCSRSGSWASGFEAMILLLTGRIVHESAARHAGEEASHRTLGEAVGGQDAAGLRGPDLDRGNHGARRAAAGEREHLRVQRRLLEARVRGERQVAADVRRAQAELRREAQRRALGALEQVAVEHERLAG